MPRTCGQWFRFASTTHGFQDAKKHIRQHIDRGAFASCIFVCSRQTRPLSRSNTQGEKPAHSNWMPSTGAHLEHWNCTKTIPGHHPRTGVTGHGPEPRVFRWLPVSQMFHMIHRYPSTPSLTSTTGHPSSHDTWRYPHPCTWKTRSSQNQDVVWCLHHVQTMCVFVW